MATVLLAVSWTDAGLGIHTATDAVTAQLGEVGLQERVQIGQDIVKEEVLQASEEYVGLAYTFFERDNRLRPHPDGIASIVFSPEAFVVDANVRAAFSRVPKQDYPNLPSFNSTYRQEDVRHIGPSLTAEMPLASLDWQGDEEKRLITLRPSFFKGELDRVATRDVFIEVRLERTDGTLVFYPFDYGFYGEVAITNLFLRTSLEGSVPEVLEISAQAVDLSDVLVLP